jgi:hypothetical protein
MVIERRDSISHRSKFWARSVAILTIGLLSASVLWVGEVRGVEPPPNNAPAVQAHHAGAVTDHTAMEPLLNVAAEPVDGVLAIVIPAGTDAAMRTRGDAAYGMPPVIRVKTGDTITIRNDDTAPHMILWAFLMPGQSAARTFTAPGSEVYSAGCAVMATHMPDFTSLFIAAR